MTPRRNSCLSIIAKMTGHCRRGRLTTKGIGSSNKGNRIDYDNLNKFATIQPENLSPSTEAPAVTQSKDVIKNQNNNNNNNNNYKDKERKKETHTFKFPTWLYGPPKGKAH